MEPCKSRFTHGSARGSGEIPGLLTSRIFRCVSGCRAIIAQLKEELNAKDQSFPVCDRFKLEEASVGTYQEVRQAERKLSDLQLQLPILTWVSSEEVAVESLRAAAGSTESNNATDKKQRNDRSSGRNELPRIWNASTRYPCAPSFALAESAVRYQGHRLRYLKSRRSRLRIS